MPTSWLLAIAGGVLIGAASALLMFTHGRIAGLSGITGSLLQRSTKDRDWRLVFMTAMVATGVIGGLIAPQAIGASVRSLPLVIIAGLLVGFGTRMGSGCTSGHGVCGMSRFSRRSIVAVMTFMTTGVLTAIIAGGLS